MNEAILDKEEEIKALRKRARQIALRKERFLNKIAEIDIELSNSKIILGKAFKDLSDLITGESEPEAEVSVDRAPEVEALTEDSVH